MEIKDFHRIKSLADQMLEKGLYDDRKEFIETGVKSESFYTFHLKILIQLLEIEEKKFDENP